MIELHLADIARPDERDDRTAIVFGDRQISYAELDGHANRVAQALLACGCQAQERIALLDHSSAQFYEIWLGAARANLVLTPLNARLSAVEAAAVLADSRARVLFIGTEFLPLWTEIRAQFAEMTQVIVLGEDYANWRDAHAAIPTAMPTTLDDDVLQIYTSGTTGTPKGVRLSSRSIFSAALAAVPGQQRSPCEQITDDDRVLLCLPHAHVAGAILGLFGLARGARLLVTRHFVPAAIVELIDTEHVTLTLMVPVMVRGLLAAMTATGRQCRSLQTLLYGAAPMPASLLQTAMQALPHCGFGQLYGLTETSGPITYLTPDDHRQIAAGDARRALSCGRPTAGVELRIVGTEGQSLGVNAIGEILCRSTQVMRGYWQRREDTLAVLQDGWLHTGDMGCLDAQGYLFIYDRRRDMIVTGGENVYPAEVENVLSSHPAVAEAAVIGVPDAQWGEAIKAFVVLKPNTALIDADLIAYARKQLAGYKLPKSVDFVTELPRNATGKVMRRLIREPFWTAQGRNVA